MHPETAADRLNMLADYGELITATPAGGGRSFQFLAFFNQGGQRVAELDLSDITPLEVIGADTHLLARAEDVTNLAPNSRVMIPSQPGFWRVHGEPEREESDGQLRVIRLLEGA